MKHVKTLISNLSEPLYEVYILVYLLKGWKDVYIWFMVPEESHHLKNLNPASSKKSKDDVNSLPNILDPQI